jgi:hypothetical protein
MRAGDVGFLSGRELMPALALFAGRIGSSIMSFLNKLSLWQGLLGIALIFWAVDHVSCHRHAAHLEKQLSSAITARDDYKRQLDSISTKRNEQAVQTKTRIVSVIKTVHDADERAKVVEQAPPAPGCKTKPEVLNADV